MESIPRIRRRRGGVIGLETALFPAGCRQQPSPEWQEVAEESAHRRTAEEAAARFDEAAYDTVTWRSGYAQGERGRTVYDHSCGKCHGRDGTGGRPSGREHDLETGSLVEPGWMYAGDVPALRQRIFTGHGQGMPARGLTELSPRDLDAVPCFVDERLPERDP
jgi:cytochrome c5